MEVDRIGAILDQLETVAPGEDHKEIRTHTLEDHLMATTAQDEIRTHIMEDHLLGVHHLEDHLLEDRRDLDSQVQAHQVRQEDPQIQQTTEDAIIKQTDVSGM